MTTQNVLLKIDSTPLSDKPLTLTMKSPFALVRGSSLPTVTNQRRSTYLIAKGGTGGYVYSIDSSSAYDGLPTGLSLNATTGIITGTPTTVGRFRFRAQVQDSSATIAEEDFTLDVVGRMVGRNITPVTGEIGAAYSYTFTTIGQSGAVTWALISGSLPPGLSLASSGILSGTPTIPAGTSYFTLRATDGGSGDTLDVITKMLVVTNPFVLIDGNALTGTAIRPSIIGSLFEVFATPLDGVAPFRYYWDDIEATKPPWLTVNPISGRIFGFPAPFGSVDPGEAFKIAIHLRDAAGGESFSYVRSTLIDPQNTVKTAENGTDKSPATRFLKYNFVDGAGTTAHATPQSDGSVDVTFDVDGADSSGPTSEVSVATVRKIAATRAY